jgi:hypothetical protein
MNTPTIETDLGKILERIEQKLEALQKDVTEIKIGQAKLETEVSTLKDDVGEFKGAQKAQIWALITILATAVLGTVIRFVITAMPAGNP